MDATAYLCRGWPGGVEPAVRAAAGLDRAVDVVWALALTGPETRRAPYGGAAGRLRADLPGAVVPGLLPPSHSAWRLGLAALPASPPFAALFSW